MIFLPYLSLKTLNQSCQSVKRSIQWVSEGTSLAGGSCPSVNTCSSPTGVCARVMICMLSLVTAAIFHESTYRKVPPAHDTMVSITPTPMIQHPWLTPTPLTHIPTASPQQPTSHFPNPDLRLPSPFLPQCTFSSTKALTFVLFE